MASVFLYHVVGDLTVAKPELVEFVETETVDAAIRAIGDSTESGIPVWRRRSGKGGSESSEMRQQRFVGILNSLDIVGFLASLDDQEKGMRTPISEIVVNDNSLLREVHPATRLIDALEMMKQGVRRLLVPKSTQWKGVSKKFSILYNGRWLKNMNASNPAIAVGNASQPSSSTTSRSKFCCLSREDVIRFVIGCLGALAPIPLSSISVLGAINHHYPFIEASLPANEAIQKLPQDPSAIAVVEPTSEGEYKIIGEISACNLWKCDYLAAAYALANLTAGQFVMGVQDSIIIRSDPKEVKSADGENNGASNGVGLTRPRRLSSKNTSFFSSTVSPYIGSPRTIYRGRSTALTCKVTSSMAAVMAQLLSHRATHVWVTEDDDDILVGMVGYADIIYAVTRHPSSISS
ncbi:hypothetical protein Droror1_Dr00025084 [Drosera rotundifolia]